MSEATDFVRATFHRASTVARPEWRFVTAVVMIDALPNVALDLADRDVPPVSALLGLITLYLQLLVTFRALETLGIAPPGYSRTKPTEGRYPSAFAVSIFTTLGILLGLVALIVPGILLFALWSLALPALAAERIGASDALSRSWRLVRPRLRAMLMLCAAWFALYLPMIGIGVGAFLAIEDPPGWLFAIFDLALSALLIWGAVIWAAAYAVIRERYEYGVDA